MLFRFLLLIMLYASVLGAASVQGLVSDSSGAAVAGAEVRIGTSGSVLWRSTTDADGAFRWTAPAPGIYHIRVQGPAGLDERESVIWLSDTEGDQRATITLQPRSIFTRVTVSAIRGAVDEAESLPEVVLTKDLADIRKRPLATLGEAFAGEPAVLVQQSTYAQVSPFLRGLTGYQLLNLVDGIRFNNSTFRSGPNQYLAFIEPNQASRVEALLGPASVQYGSDSLGGTINVITTPPVFSPEPGRWITHADAFIGAASADLSTAGNARVSAAREKTFLLFGASGRKHNDLRAGGGFDSRNAFRRFFGMSPGQVQDLVGNRQQDSGFRQYGIETKAAFRPRASDLVTLNYQRGVQDQVRGYKDLLGGLGRLQSDFDPQVLNWFYARYEKMGLGFLDSLTGTFSLNSQADGSARRNLLYSDPLTRDWTRVNAWGYSGQATTHYSSRLLLSFGGDIYDERVASERTVSDPVTGRVTQPRPLYPDQSQYQNLGAFSQASVDLLSNLRLTGGIRFTGVRFATREDAALNIPKSSQWFRDFTFQTAVRWQLTGVLGMHALVSRGFRAPNLNDLGALGLNDLGYEVPSAAAIAAGALLSTDSGEAALSSGKPLKSLKAESLMSYEWGMRVNLRRVHARVQLFDSELYDPIMRRTLLFPANAVPSELAGLPVTALPPTAAQLAQGVVTVATPVDNRAVKAFVNDGRSRYYGVETLAHVSITHRFALDAGYSYILGRDLNPNRAIRRLPPQSGSLSLRYLPSGRRPWIEFAVTASGAQTRLSGGDRDDERIGASFRRSDIASFFRGSRVSAYVDPATGVFRPTGETLLQIQNRVLPVGAVINGVRVTDDNSRVPLYLTTAGWLNCSIRSGFPLAERWHLNAALENIFDRNYRLHGSGIDSPGIGAWVGVGYRF